MQQASGIVSNMISNMNDRNEEATTTIGQKLQALVDSLTDADKSGIEDSSGAVADFSNSSASNDKTYLDGMAVAEKTYLSAVANANYIHAAGGAAAIQRDSTIASAWAHHLTQVDAYVAGQISHGTLMESLGNYNTIAAAANAAYDQAMDGQNISEQRDTTIAAAWTTYQTEAGRLHREFQTAQAADNATLRNAMATAEQTQINTVTQARELYTNSVEDERHAATVDRTNDWVSKISQLVSLNANSSNGLAQSLADAIRNMATQYPVMLIDELGRPIGVAHENWFWNNLANKADLAADYLASVNRAKTDYLVGPPRIVNMGPDNIGVVFSDWTGMLQLQADLQISQSAATRDYNKATVQAESQRDRTLASARANLAAAKGTWEQGLVSQTDTNTTVEKPSLDPPTTQPPSTSSTARQLSTLFSGGLVSAEPTSQQNGTSNAAATDDDLETIPINETPAPIDPPAPWSPPSLSELDPALAGIQMNDPIVPVVPDDLLTPKPQTPSLPPLNVLPDDPGYVEPFDEEAFLENARRQQELRRLGQQLDQLIGSINEAEKDRRNWQYTHVAGTFGLWSLAYGPMGLPEKVQRAELERLLVRIIEAELAAGITIEELMNQPSISAAPEQSWWKEWINSAGHSGSLDMLGKPVGRAATELAEGLWSTISDFPGFVDGLTETLKDVSEDPVGFYERVSEAIHRRAQLLTPSGADVSVGYQQILIEIAAGELLSLGAGKLTKAGLTKVLGKLRQQSQILATVRALEEARLEAINAAMPGTGVTITREIAEQFRDFLKSSLGVDVEFVTDLKNAAGNPSKGFFRNGKIYLNLTDILEGRADVALLVDEWSHAWNDLHGRGKWIPKWKSELDGILLEIDRLKSSSKLYPTQEYLFHQLELLNFLNSPYGSRLPFFLEHFSHDLLEFLRYVINDR